MPRKPKPTTASESPIKRRAHRPLYVPSAQDRGNVESMTAYGIKQRDICANLNISLATLHKHFRVEINTGASKAVALVAGALYKQALAGDVPAQKYFLNNRARDQWADRVTIIDGGTELNPKTATEAELDAEIARLGKRPAVLRAAKTTVH